MKERLPSYGGQAVIEGVMMRGRKYVAMAMRAPDGKIVLHTQALASIYRSKLATIPFLRGLVTLWDSLVLGMQLITLSANTQGGEQEKIEGPVMVLTYVISLLVAVGLFMLAPAAVGQLIERWLHWNAWWGNLLEGIIRLGLLIGYIWSVGKIPEIGRVFAYHGAEHKTINAYENRAELSPESVAHFSLEHPRCGTSFLLTLVLISIVLFAFLGPLPIFWRLVSRILLLPVLAGLSYEYIRWMADHIEWGWVKLLIRPNLALQRLTTRQPSLDMLEVAITAFNEMIALETAEKPEVQKQPVISGSQVIPL